MPRYYFNLRDAVVIDDEEGVDLADIAAAKKCALVTARELACQEIRDGKLHLHHCIEVVDEDRRPVFTLPYRAAFEIKQ